MAFIALIIGVILVVAAIRGSQTSLFTALKTDVPGFAIWAAAIIAVAAIGFVPGLKPISRGLLALVITVILLENAQKIVAGFQSVWTGAASQAGSSGIGAAAPTANALENSLNALSASGGSISTLDELAATPTGTNG
jgi:hypothetical protein